VRDITEPHFADVLDRNGLPTGRTWPRSDCCAVPGGRPMLLGGRHTVLSEAL
jgi:hypothetical protein